MFRITIFVLLGSALLAACVLLWTHDGAAMAADLAPAGRTPGIPPGPETRRVSEITSHAALSQPDQATIHSRPLRPHRGVRGVITSPRIRLADGSNAVDPKAWEATVYALVPAPKRRTIDRIGILRRRSPTSSRGDFEIDLPTGSHLLLVEHRVQDASECLVHEAWYAYVDIDATHRLPIDLGSHTFAAATIAGRVAHDDGRLSRGATVSCSDESVAPGESFPRGVHLRSDVDGAGRFAFSLSSPDASLKSARVSATEAGLRAAAETVTPGSFTQLTLRRSEPATQVTIEVPWPTAMTVWIHARDRKLYFMREAGSPRGGAQVFEETRHLPAGRYAIEVYRDVAGDSREWAVKDVAIDGGGERRVRFDSAFRPTREMTGRTRPGERVAWVTRASDGSTWIRETTRADAEGRFIFRAMPTSAITLAIADRMQVVDEGFVRAVDLGDV